MKHYKEFHRKSRMQTKRKFPNGEMKRGTGKVLKVPFGNL